MDFRLTLLEVLVLEGFVALAREVNKFRVLSFAMERHKERIADEACIAIEVVIDCFAQETVRR